MQGAKKIDMNNVPQHIAFIMDGNGRWAKKRRMPRTFGHHEGIKTIRKIALKANEIGIKAMTVYAFSTENFSRPEEEVAFIFKLPLEFFKSYIKELVANNVRVTLIGHLEKAPEATRKVILDAIETTKNNTGLILCFAFIYGSQDEILSATKQIAEEYKKGLVELSEINERYFESKLMTNFLPPVDLMVRTSGEIRLSNFMLWQLAYAEMIFTDVYWPDFNEQNLMEVIEEYQRRSRRFGGISK